MREILSPLGGFLSPFGQLTSPLAIYAVLGFRPPIVLDFENEKYFTGGSATTFDSALTTSRASSATYSDGTGTTQTAAINEARTDHHVWNGTEWEKVGLLVEPTASTNLFLNSGTLATQGVTATAVPHTVHFTGTGTITFSGAYTGSLVGTGTGEENRVYLTFTPTAGTVTCTVTGDVSSAQFEALPYASSYIPTAGAAATRAADTTTIPSANMPWPEPTALSARNDLINNSSWIITDGGAA